MENPSIIATPRQWRPSTLIKASLVAHAAAIGVVLTRPSLWPWALGGVVINHALLAASGLWPRSALLGPNWRRLPQPAQARGQVAITIDDGPDPEVTPQALEILERHHSRATFFCIGERVARFPELAREIVRRGHAIENHSLRHSHAFALLGPRMLAREVSEAQQLIASVTGDEPRFFRAPAGLRNPLLEPILARNGLQLASWTRRGFDTVTKRPGVVLARLVRRLSAGDIVLLHDGHAARTEAGTPVLIEVLPPLLEAIAAAGLHPVTLRAALS